MMLLSWSMAIALLFSVLIQSLAFYRGTICRQKAWLISFELKTRSLLPNSKMSEESFHYGCRIMIKRTQEVQWTELVNQRVHLFSLPIKGQL